MQRLFIAEKPELARAIVEGLGGGDRKGSYYQCGQDKVTWCIGHMLELWEPEDFDPKYKDWKLEDLPIRTTPIKYKPKENTKDQLKAVLSLLADADEIVHAGDPDAEGQLIVDELLTYAGNKKPVKRFMTNDNNTSIVIKALNNLKDNSEFYWEYQSALARNIGDQLYGFNMTRAYTVAARAKGYTGMLNMGRVQTPMLGLVVIRCRANANHEKQYYYEVIGDFRIASCPFSAKYIPALDAPVDDKKRLTEKDFADDIAKQCGGKPATVESIETSEKEASAPLTYNMLKLQSDAARQFNYKPDQVMKITQELREKYKLITYNGSDSQYLNEEQHADAPAVLSAIARTAKEFDKLLAGTDSSIKSRAFNNKNVGAHHAIIPTQATANLDDLSEPLRNVYLMIAKRYIAQFYPKQKYRETAVVLSVDGHLFGVNSKITLLEGWKTLFTAGDNNDDNESTDEPSISIDLSVLGKADSGTCDQAKVLNKETKPLPLYTMSTLLEDLTRVAKYIKDPDIKRLLIEKDKDKRGEHGGIGTSRTRDQIIKNLYQNGFLEDQGKNIIATPIGEQFFDALPEIATSPDMTALWHEQQLMIAARKNTCEGFVDELMEFIGKQIATVKEHGLDIKVETHACHVCTEGFLKMRKPGKDGFWGCNRYPECKATVPNKGDKPDFKSLETTPCPECKAPLKRIKGQYGFFWPCKSCNINFKDSRGKPVVAPKANKDETEFDCRDCGKKLIRRVSEKGTGDAKKSTIWYGCSGFPTCKRTYFDSNGTPKYPTPTVPEGQS